MLLRGRAQQGIAMILLGMSYVVYAADAKDLFPDNPQSFEGSKEKRQETDDASRLASRAGLKIYYDEIAELFYYPDKVSDHSDEDGRDMIETTAPATRRPEAVKGALPEDHFTKE